MRPLLLQGHERALTKIKFNVDGDLLFSAAKDNLPSVWFSHNGERIGLCARIRSLRAHARRQARTRATRAPCGASTPTTTARVS